MKYSNFHKTEMVHIISRLEEHYKFMMYVDDKIKMQLFFKYKEPKLVHHLMCLKCSGSSWL